MNRLFISLLAVFVSCSCCIGKNNWKAAIVISDEEVQRQGIGSFFVSEEISDSVFSVMRGKSMPQGCTVGRSELRYLRVLHRNAKGESQTGEIVCNKAIAADLLYIFRRLYEEGYPISRMVLIDNYDANDEKSMTANNTSCFCYRKVRGSTRVSTHSRGLAIDINPLYNPCVRKRQGRTVVEPQAGSKYANRTAKGEAGKYMIRHDSIIYRLFKERGFTWGGNWRSLKDYQHFEKSL